MFSPHGEITHVSDTALLVAACRAMETESADGFVRDPFAARLAGERGMAILRAMPHAEMFRFGVGARSRFADELVTDAVSTKGIAAVVCVGCGLDTRPWRLDLPKELRWIEVDFAEMLDYKDERMAGEMPRCNRERMTADVNDAAQRRAIWEVVGAAPAMMITEGLLMYLPRSTVQAMAAEAGVESGITYWLSDVVTSTFTKAIAMDTTKTVGHVQAPDSLEGEQIVEVVQRHGWIPEARRSYLTDMAFAMARVRHMMGDRAQQGPPPEALGDPSGVHLWKRG